MGDLIDSITLISSHAGSCTTARRVAPPCANAWEDRIMHRLRFLLPPPSLSPLPNRDAMAASLSRLSTMRGPGRLK
jgi:hypothetical protein